MTLEAEEVRNDNTDDCFLRHGYPLSAVALLVR